MKYVYFVSYISNGVFGMAEYISDTLIETFDDVVEMKDWIDKTKGLEIIIINWKLLKG